MGMGEYYSCAGLRACGLAGFGVGACRPVCPPLRRGGVFPGSGRGKLPASPQPRISFTPLTPLTIYPPADHHRWSTGLITSLLCFLSGR